MGCFYCQKSPVKSSALLRFFNIPNCAHIVIFHTRKLNLHHFPTHFSFLWCHLIHDVLHYRKYFFTFDCSIIFQTLFHHPVFLRGISPVQIKATYLSLPLVILWRRLRGIFNLIANWPSIDEVPDGCWIVDETISWRCSPYIEKVTRNFYREEMDDIRPQMDQICKLALRVLLVDEEGVLFPQLWSKICKNA